MFYCFSTGLITHCLLSINFSQAVLFSIFSIHKCMTLKQFFLFHTFFGLPHHTTKSPYLKIQNPLTPLITFATISTFYLYSSTFCQHFLLFFTPLSFNNNFLLKVYRFSPFNCHHLIFDLKINRRFGFIPLISISRINSLCSMVTPFLRINLKLAHNLLSLFLTKKKSI